MEIINQQVTYTVYSSDHELDISDASLLQEARAAAGTSYAPYSRYHVGAAVRLANGMIFRGSNQENISFPVGLCAERVALFSAMAAGTDSAVVAVAITAKADDFPVTDPVTPCGMCRQALLEYEMKFSQPVRLIMSGESGSVIVIGSVQQLLPLAFVEKGLIK